jgi:O-6-methylguanine DNA methyltransferase
MEKVSYSLFETPFGTCGIAWCEPACADCPPAIILLQLPEATPKKTESRIAQKLGVRQPGVPPRHIAAIIEKIRLHLRGEVQDFRDVAIRLEGAAPFARQVYEAVRKIPPGQTRTYGEIAKALGLPSAAQDVGQALSKNPIPIIVPCHRVSAAGGKPGGFSAYGGRATKAKLLALEGAQVNLHLFS